jgi:pimeloyl-ACP methyl ester carboxylesterase
MLRRSFLGGALAAGGCAASPPASDPPADFRAVRWATSSDGVRIAYRDSGGRGRPVFFCSGGGQAMAVWSSIADPLSASRRVILHDRRGNGDSDPGAPETHSFETFRSDALAVMDAAGADDAVVCGLAFGSRVALRMALDAPARVSGLILFDATGGPAAPEPQRRAGAEEAQRLRTAAGIPTPERDPAWTANRHPEAQSFNARALQGHPPWIEGLSTVRCPTLVAVGEQDPNLDGGKRLAREIPGARFELFPMTGHGSNAQRPDLLLASIRAFLVRQRL